MLEREGRLLSCTAVYTQADMTFIFVHSVANPTNCTPVGLDAQPTTGYSVPSISAFNQYVRRPA